ncbi:TRAP transporter small permease subunit [Arenibaculum sp.]|jgi:TRAP-type mannitol/chloroaromatic compound transport system permease small subunit|uniref:TRAP transporter small permease subunit n=1 Tax=Arenibaculum sp. TaxID=2865862 RepID=UPI002E10FF59|nr:TRAP transporter small permease subunit [Arenibaculum sp.]
MSPSFFSLVDRFGLALNAVAMVLLVLLIGVTLWEVAARYVFDAPTIWGFDLAWMLNGGLFLLALAETTRRGGHVRVDVVSSRLPAGWQRMGETLFMALLFAPGVGVLAWTASRRFVQAVATGEVDPVSSWAPVMWPFHLAVAVGLWALLLQMAVSTARRWRAGPGEAAS